MRKLQVLPIVVLMTILFSCAPSVTVNHDFDPGYDFTKLKTFNWIPVKGNATISDLTIKRFQNAVNTELEAKGLKQSEENPDFLIAVQTTAQTKLNVTDYGYSYGRYWGAGRGGVDVNTYQEGTVYLDFVDGKSKELFWRGTGTSVVDRSMSGEEQDKKFAFAAAKILANFPPSAK